MLTEEICKHLSDTLEHMKQAHPKACLAMKAMKKLVPQIPNGTLWLLLQAVVQPCIMLRCCQLCWVKCRKTPEQKKNYTLLDMIPNGSQSHNLPGPVKLLTPVIHYEIKTETGIKSSMITTANLFDAQEKSLRQAMKGVWYELGTQRRRHESAPHDKEEESSSKTEDNSYSDDNREEGGIAKIKPLKKCKKMH